MAPLICGVVALAAIAGAGLVYWRCEIERQELLHRNEELTDSLLRAQGREVVFRPRIEQLRKSPGYFDRKRDSLAENTKGAP